VIPHISSSTKIPPPCIKNYIEKFENMWMKQHIEGQDQKIKELERENEGLRRE